MRIAFNPALGATTCVAVPSLNGDAHMRLLATLGDNEYAELKKLGAIVQAWSDMPGGGRCAGQWGELDFVEIDAAPAVDENALSLAPPAEESPAAAPTHTLALPLVVPLAGRAMEFSFTYRLLYPSGQVRWLGQYGNNGKLVVERSEPAIDLEGAWEGDAENAVLDRSSGADAGLVIARLRKQTDYEVCSIGGRPGAMGSPTLVVLPKASAGSLTRANPLVMSTIPHDASLVHDEASGAIKLFGKAVVRLDAGIPASHTSEMSPEVPGFTVLWAKHSDLAQVVLVPMPNVLSQQTRAVDVPLSPFGVKEGMRYAVYGPSSGEAHVGTSSTNPSLRINVPPSGGAFAIAPLRTLGPVDASVLTPHVATTTSALPTPPPSPPQMPSPLPSLAQIFADEPQPSVALAESPESTPASPKSTSSASSSVAPRPKRRGFLFRCLKYMFLLPFVFAVVFYRVVIKRRGRKAMLKTPPTERSPLLAEQRSETAPEAQAEERAPAVQEPATTAPVGPQPPKPVHLLHATVAPGKTVILLHPYDTSLEEHVKYEFDGHSVHDVTTTQVNDGLLATFDSGKGGLLKISYT
ncbi:hypothetical protein BD626DRAFT_571937 [Schizophyllum amplum]|uniref:Uncharacterized protein n=1 Tax=Schizophyllum amplum TaxID=97359 RepID=A0A550C5U2_9AGAR|nr:hypothetical protein BD626DRAFT_571937 [Auriculariopsis ampla]